jgi:hypothetical protein
MRNTKVAWGLAGGAVLVAGAVWFVMTDRALPQVALPVSAPAAQEQQARESQRPESQSALPSAKASAPSAVFEARFKASKERVRPAPDPAIANARTFAEAFQAMKRAEAPPAESAAANPFGTTR